MSPNNPTLHESRSTKDTKELIWIDLLDFQSMKSGKNEGLQICQALPLPPSIAWIQDETSLRVFA